jgi:hypothetical protein
MAIRGLTDLACLADVTQKLNILNAEIQGGVDMWRHD